MKKFNQGLVGQTLEYLPLAPWTHESTIGRIWAQAPEVDGHCEVPAKFSEGQPDVDHQDQRFPGRNAVRRKIMKKIWIVIATFFGIGYLPVAPGTWASLLTALIIYFTPLSTAAFACAGPDHGGRLRHRHPGRRGQRKAFPEKGPAPLRHRRSGRPAGQPLVPAAAGGFLRRRFFAVPLFRYFKAFPGEQERSAARTDSAS